MTPLLMLALMTGPYLLVRCFPSRWPNDNHRRAAAAIGLGLLFAFTAVGHFLLTDDMARMLPDEVPARKGLVLLTGLLEFALAAGFFIPRTRRIAGVLACVLLILFFPANVYAAIHHVPMGGHVNGPIYLLIRAPLQAAIFGWAWWFTVRTPG